MTPPRSQVPLWTAVPLPAKSAQVHSKQANFSPCLCKCGNQRGLSPPKHPWSESFAFPARELAWSSQPPLWRLWGQSCECSSHFGRNNEAHWSLCARRWSCRRRSCPPRRFPHAKALRAIPDFSNPLPSTWLAVWLAFSWNRVIDGSQTTHADAMNLIDPPGIREEFSTALMMCPLGIQGAEAGGWEAGRRSWRDFFRGFASDQMHRHFRSKTPRDILADLTACHRTTSLSPQNPRRTHSSTEENSVRIPGGFFLANESAREDCDPTITLFHGKANRTANELLGSGFEKSGMARSALACGHLHGGPDLRRHDHLRAHGDQCAFLFHPKCELYSHDWRQNRQSGGWEDQASSRAGNAKVSDQGCVLRRFASILWEMGQPFTGALANGAKASSLVYSNVALSLGITGKECFPTHQETASFSFTCRSPTSSNTKICSSEITEIFM